MGQHGTYWDSRSYSGSPTCFVADSIDRSANISNVHAIFYALGPSFGRVPSGASPDALLLLGFIGMRTLAELISRRFYERSSAYGPINSSTVLIPTQGKRYRFRAAGHRADNYKIDLVRSLRSDDIIPRHIVDLGRAERARSAR